MCRSSYSHTGYYYDQDVKIVTDGLLGLGPRIGSLNSQLKEQQIIERNAVGQCLSRRDRDYDAGYIFFGTEGVDLDSLAWTPMENLPHRPSVWYHTPINIQFCTLNRVVTYDRIVLSLQFFGYLT
jgi:hypothetical protein